MAVTLSMRFLGEDQVLKTFENARFALGDMTAAWERVATAFAKMEEELFESEGHGLWPELSEPYAAWKAKKYPDMPIMRREDVMFNELTKRPFGIEIISPHKMQIGTTKFYARIHQKGGWVQGNPPMRKVIDLRQKDKDLIVKIVQGQLVAAMRARDGVPAYAPGETP